MIEPITLDTVRPAHMCRPPEQAHFARPATEWTCTCGKQWRVTQNHVGRICGCGWKRIT